jgi:hypothetical protein
MIDRWTADDRLTATLDRWTAIDDRLTTIDDRWRAIEDRPQPINPVCRTNEKHIFDIPVGTKSW